MLISCLNIHVKALGRRAWYRGVKKRPPLKRVKHKEPWVGVEIEDIVWMSAYDVPPVTKGTKKAASTKSLKESTATTAGKGKSGSLKESTASKASSGTTGINKKSKGLKNSTSSLASQKSTTSSQITSQKSIKSKVTKSKLSSKISRTVKS